jgi:hypothetical protein
MTSKNKSAHTGDCFEAALKFVRQPEIMEYADDYRLVHGNVAKLRQNEAVNHAWVEEEDEIVHEVSNGRYHVYLKKVYYEKHQIKNVRTYTPEEALCLMIRHGHFGPWD